MKKKPLATLRWWFVDNLDGRIGTTSFYDTREIARGMAATDRRSGYKAVVRRVRVLVEEI